MKREEKQKSRRTFLHTCCAVPGGAVLPRAAVAPLSIDAIDGICLKMAAINNTMRMGHCAPSVLKTLLDNDTVTIADPDKLIAVSAGLPGGIGDTGAECGGITGAMLFWGLAHGEALKAGDYGEALTEGDRYLRLFSARHGSVNCRDLGKSGNMEACFKAIYTSPSLYVNSAASTADDDRAFAEKRGSLPSLILAEHLRKADFHCARCVLENLSDVLHIDNDILNSAWAFFGGTLCNGWTCGALIAGIMAMGLRNNEIGKSYLRVIRMLAMMYAGKDAMGDDVNEFNKSINEGKRLADWFEQKFGSTSCNRITGVDLGAVAGVESYIAEGRSAACLGIARRVAEKVRDGQSAR